MRKIKDNLEIQDNEFRHSVGIFNLFGSCDERLSLDKKLLAEFVEKVVLSLEDKHIFEKIYVVLEKRKEFPFIFIMR